MNKVARVLVASQAQNLDRLFDYLVPVDLQPYIEAGARVIIPFQNRPNLGFVWELAEDSEFQNLKSVQEILDIPALINHTQFTLVNWLADYYFCSRLEVAKLCLPPGANLTRKATYQMTGEMNEVEILLSNSFPADEAAQIIDLLNSGLKAGWPADQWPKKFKDLPGVWDFFTKRKILSRTYEIAQPKTKAKTCKRYQWIADDCAESTETGRRIQQLLQNQPLGLASSEICAAAEVSSSVLKRLMNQGKIKCVETMATRKPAGFDEDIFFREIHLNSEQHMVFKCLCEKEPGSLNLIHGVTGSGKTEIYFEMAAEAMRNGCQVLYLVPEISLTPQTLERARNRFGETVALLHSNMSDGERFDQWYRVKRGEARFVLGARSAVFAPFEKLGLIIIDEEHETTYKQEENPRYHIRQVVQKLAEITGAKVIFGSATPSVESFYNALAENYQLLQLKQRYNCNPLPEVTVVDMRSELRNGNRNILSQSLFQAITESLAYHEQIILLLNRRGHSTFILCRDCGKSLHCPNCDVALTYHLTDKILRCHYCDYRQQVPNTCPSCGSSRIRYFGHGTQKLEEELVGSFPNARIVRMDVDSTAKKGSHHQIYRQLTAGEVDILLGTQMIAKGLDLPKVTLVGVISADSTLNIPDFRAAERTFQLLTQVAGRAGRGEKTGKVIFQAYDPDHYALRFAKEHDYQSFYQEEIEQRRRLHYPPFAEMVKVGFSGLNQIKVMQAAEHFYQIVKVIQESLAGSGDSAYYYIEVLGPGPTLVPRIQNNYRWQLLIRSNHSAWLCQLVKEAWNQYPFQKYPDVKLIKDRNPYMVI